MTNATSFLVIALGVWTALGVLYIICEPALERHAYRSLFLGGPFAWLAFVIFAAIAYVQEWRGKRHD